MRKQTNKQKRNLPTAIRRANSSTLNAIEIYILEAKKYSANKQFDRPKWWHEMNDEKIEEI